MDSSKKILGFSFKNKKGRSASIADLFHSEAELSGKLREDCDPSTPSFNRLTGDGLLVYPASEPIQPRRGIPIRHPPTESTAVSSTGPVAWIPHDLGNVFHRYGHMVNVVDGKSDEVYLFGGDKNYQMMDDFYRIDLGTSSGNYITNWLGMPARVIPLKGSGSLPRASCMGASVLHGNKLYCIQIPNLIWMAFDKSVWRQVDS